MFLNEPELKKKLKKLVTNPLSMKEILTRLDVPSKERSALRKMIRNVAKDGVIVRIKGGRYGLPDKMSLVTGVISGHPDGYGFVIPDDPAEKDVFIGPRAFDDAMHSDRVVCRVERTRPDGKRDGKVIRVLERAFDKIVGYFDKTTMGGFVVPFDKRIIHDIYIPRGQSMRAKEGQAVIAEIVVFPSKSRQAQGKVVKILGHKDDPKVEIEIATARFKLRSEFPRQALGEAKKLFAPEEKDIKGRLDLRGRPIVTIDGETAKDFDDAVEVEQLKNGDWRLGVHIADVTHYVLEGGSLDKEAYTRGTSVYFPGTVIPMLPFRLSNELCSLKPNVDRLTLSCSMTFDKNGELQKYEIAESIIRSVERMTYTAVAAILDGDDMALVDRYAHLIDKFRNMKKLAEVLRNKRRKDGALDFDLPEPEIVLDVTGRPEAVILSERNIAHIIIEEFMLAANRTVAGHFLDRKVPAIYRVHDEPDIAKVESFREFITAFGVRFRPGEKLTSRKMQSIMDNFAGKPEEKLITHTLLRSMKQARYTTQNIGHFGLAFEKYTHFTSPIRRYPDLIVHRLLKMIAQGKRPDEKMEERLKKIADHSSVTERNAEEAERDMVKYHQTQYMASHIGNEFDGVISGVVAFGFFVELLNPPVEGLCRLSSISDDYYKYHEDRHMLVGERNGKTFTLGDKVRVEVAQVSPVKRQIDFELIGFVSSTGKFVSIKGRKTKQAPRRFVPGKPRRHGKRRRK